MSWITGLAIYFVMWWIVLFAVLPWGSRPPEQAEPGMMDGAPAAPRIGMKFLATTIVTAILFAIFYAVYESGLISFREMARNP
jgi:predicted secreted protein